MARNKFNIDEELDVPFNWAQFSRAFVYMSRYKKNIITAFIISAITITLSLLSPVIQRTVIDVYLPAGAISSIITIGLGFAVAQIMVVLLNRLRTKITVKVGQAIVSDIRTDLFGHLQKLGFEYYDSRPHGKILTRVVNYVNSVADFLSGGFVNALLEMITLVIILFFMLFISPKLTLVVLAGLPVFLVYVVVTKSKQRRFRQIRANKQSNTTAYLAESINGARVTQAFAREAYNENIFDGLLKESKHYTLRSAYLANGMWPMSALIARLVGMTIYIAAVYLFREDFIENGVFQLGAVSAMLQYSWRFWFPIQRLGNIYNQFLDTMAYLERIFQVLDEPVSVEDGNTASDLPPIHGTVTFDNVLFEYEKNNPVLRRVSFDVKAGESIALVGPTGAGKSTIINLLSRFYDVTDGAVLVDGINIADVRLKSLRRQMGVMLQDTFIFSGTILDNIRYGRLDASDDECIAAAKAVRAHDFIVDMEEGYNTVTRELGQGLSAGQKQLISFARTLLSDPRILILDEATSSIDTNTEQLVQEGIAALLKGRTSFIVAHRLSTIKNCDRIMYIERGIIAEQGSHADLMRSEGLYHNLYMSQLNALRDLAASG